MVIWAGVMTWELVARLIEMSCGAMTGFCKESTTYTVPIRSSDCVRMGTKS